MSDRLLARLTTSIALCLGIRSTLNCDRDRDPRGGKADRIKICQGFNELFNIT
ncbi:MAG: hypothetical protein MUD14_13215 [Hydrococcus sp. Prado102]|nr:hypothetical protein [Hydrococcus sp. Prado102]